VVYLAVMFPLSCAHVRAHAGHETSTHKKTWSAHKYSFRKCFSHISYTSFHMHINSGKVLDQKICMLHTLRGNIG